MVPLIPTPFAGSRVPSLMPSSVPNSSSCSLSFLLLAMLISPGYCKRRQLRRDFCDLWSCTYNGGKC